MDYILWLCATGHSDLGLLSLLVSCDWPRILGVIYARSLPTIGRSFPPTGDVPDSHPARFESLGEPLLHLSGEGWPPERTPQPDL